MTPICDLWGNVNIDVYQGEPMRREYLKKKSLSLGKITEIVPSSSESWSRISKSVFPYNSEMTAHVSHHDLGT